MSMAGTSGRRLRRNAAPQPRNRTGRSAGQSWRPNRQWPKRRIGLGRMRSYLPQVISSLRTRQSTLRWCLEVVRCGPARTRAASSAGGQSAPGHYEDTVAAGGAAPAGPEAAAAMPLAMAKSVIASPTRQAAAPGLRPGRPAPPRRPRRARSGVRRSRRCRVLIGRWRGARSVAIAGRVRVKDPARD